jgi:hypothetical protein
MKIYKRPNNFDYDYSQKIDKGLDAPFSKIPLLPFLLGQKNDILCGSVLKALSPI